MENCYLTNVFKFPFEMFWIRPPENPIYTGLHDHTLRITSLENFNAILNISKFRGGGGVIRNASLLQVWFNIAVSDAYNSLKDELLWTEFCSYMDCM